MTMESWVVEVDDEANKLPQLLEKEKNVWKKHSIYKLPTSITTLNEKAYKPRVISFGPYHEDDTNLKRMEPHKHRAMLYFLRRSGKSMQCCVDLLLGAAGELMDAYDSLDPKWRKDSEGFLKMMIRDGCFMLELLRSSTAALSSCGYAENDPIFSKHGTQNVLPIIKRDMLMLENQLPMSLLTKLLSVEDQQSQVSPISEDQLDERVNSLIGEFCFSGSNLNFNVGKRKHLLDLYRQVLIEGDREGRAIAEKRAKAGQKARTGVAARLIRCFLPKSPPCNETNMPSVTELHEAGISIKDSKSKNITDIYFEPGLFKGVLYLPWIQVDDLTESVYLNLIAFERFHVGIIENDVTSYAAFMDEIIDNARDVNLLRSRKSKVVGNALGSDKAVAELFNSLSKDVPLDSERNLSSIQNEVIRYCNMPLNRWRGNLSHTYFTSPWSVISLIAAILLFGLTIVQTIFTIKQTYNK